MEMQKQISPSDFYLNNSEKTLLNWFCYEIASGFETRLKNFTDDLSVKKWVKKRNIRSMAIALSNQLKKIILTKQLSTALNLKIAPEWIINHIKSPPKKILEEITFRLNNSIAEQAEMCETCPTQCLKKKNAPCFMFDDPSYFKPPLDVDISSSIQLESLKLPVTYSSLLDSLLSSIINPNTKKKQVLSFRTRFEEKNASTPQQNIVPNIFQFKITLRHIKPPIWRRILIENTATFEELHEAIQQVFGWSGYHLHDFFFPSWGEFREKIVIDQQPPEESDHYDRLGDFQEEEVVLRDFFSEQNKRCHYTYDFGDNWEHLIILEQILPVNQEQTYPICIKEKGECPFDDSGGPWEYMAGRDEDNEKIE